MKKPTRLLVCFIIFILIMESFLTGVIHHSRGWLFQLLTDKAGPIYTALSIYFLNYLFLDFFQAIKGYFITKISLLFRSDRTTKVMKKIKKGITNTPQRIQEDIKLSYHSRFTVWAEYFISATIVIQLILINIHVPMLTVAALIYAVISIFIAARFNPKLTAAEKTVQQEEANYRSNLVDSINPGSLVAANKASLFAEVTKTQYLLFTKLQLGLVTVLPYIILIPSLMSGIIDLGTLVKHQATFGLIVVNAAVLIQYYTVLIRGKASEERVKELERK